MILKEVLEVTGKVVILVTVENGYPVCEVDKRHLDDIRIDGDLSKYETREVREITTKVFSDRTIYIDLK